MPKGIVNGSSAELLVSRGRVHLQLRSVLIEKYYSAQSVQCPVTVSGDRIVFPADEQLYHIKPPLDLKLISNFAGSLPTERSGWEVAIKMRIPPGQAGGIPGAQTVGKGECGRAAGGLHACFSKYTSSVVRQRTSVFQMLVEQHHLQVQKWLRGLLCEM